MYSLVGAFALRDLSVSQLWCSAKYITVWGPGGPSGNTNLGMGQGFGRVQAGSFLLPVPLASKNVDIAAYVSVLLSISIWSHKFNQASQERLLREKELGLKSPFDVQNYCV